MKPMCMRVFVCVEEILKNAGIKHHQSNGLMATNFSFHCKCNAATERELPEVRSILKYGSLAYPCPNLPERVPIQKHQKDNFAHTAVFMSVHCLILIDS